MIVITGLPGLPGSIRVDTTVTDGNRQGKKGLKLINTPSHSPNDGQASHCLNSHSYLSSSLVPSYALYFLITVLYMHHNPSISDLSFCSCKPGYMFFLELFDTVLMKSTKIHSPLDQRPSTPISSTRRRMAVRYRLPTSVQRLLALSFGRNCFDSDTIPQDEEPWTIRYDTIDCQSPDGRLSLLCSKQQQKS